MKILNIRLSLVIIFLSIVPILLPLLKLGFFPTQDFIHVARLYQMVKSFQDGQFPVRWVPDFRYGDPTFNFYAPLPYYAGIPFKSLGLSYLDTIKLLFGLGFILSALSMFYLGRKLFGNMGGILTAIFYTYAPYHSVDVYVRGAMSESWALIFFPLIFLSSFNLSQKICFKNIAWTALALAGLFYTHNVMTMLFAPFIALWFIFLTLKTRSKLKVISFLALSLILAVMLAGSFLLPAYFEKSFVQSERLNTGYFDFRGHFVAVKQWVIPFWGYGASLWGDEDGMSFQVGLVHIAGFIISLFLIFLWRKREHYLLTLTLFISILLSLFMQHNRSAPVWEFFKILSFTQFPWRYLGITIFLISLASGLVVSRKSKIILAISLSLTILVIAVNLQYFHPESYYLDSIDDHYISDKVLLQDDKIPKDYLPIWVKDIQAKIDLPRAKGGEIQVKDFTKRSDQVSFEIEAQTPADVEVPLTYFPGWKVFLNNQEVKQEDPSNLGLMRFKVNPGNYHVLLKFSDTPIRTVGNILSLLAIAVTILFLTRKINE